MKLNRLLRGIASTANTVSTVTNDVQTIGTLINTPEPVVTENPTSVKHDAIYEATRVYASAVLPLISNTEEREAIDRLLQSIAHLIKNLDT